MQLTMDVVPSGSIIAEDAKHIVLWLSGFHSEATRKAFGYDIERFLAFVNYKPLAKIDLMDMRMYEHSLSHYKPATVQRRLTALRAFWKFAHEQEYIPKNPAKFLKLPTVPHDVNKRTLGKEEIDRLLAVVYGRNFVLLTVLFHTAGRASEVVNLRWDDITIYPHQKGCTVYLFGKGSKGRYIHLNQRVTDILHSLPQPHTGYIFKPKGGNRHTGMSEHISTHQVWHIVRQATRLAGIDKPVSAHWFRHSGASHAHAAGMTLADLRDSLGHSNISVTNIYAASMSNNSISDYLGSGEVEYD